MGVVGVVIGVVGVVIGVVVGVVMGVVVGVVIGIVVGVVSFPNREVAISLVSFLVEVGFLSKSSLEAEGNCSSASLFNSFCIEISKELIFTSTTDILGLFMSWVRILAIRSFVTKKVFLAAEGKPRSLITMGISG
eukprot:Gb_37895 [translate_table: standard]